MAILDGVQFFFMSLGDSDESALKCAFISVSENNCCIYGTKNGMI